MRGFRINSHTRTVTAHEYSGEYQDLYPIIGCTTFTTIDINEEGDTVFVDDEGLLKPVVGWFGILGFPQPIAGNGFVLGTDGEGEAQAPTITLEGLMERLVWVKPLGVTVWLALSAADLKKQRAINAPDLGNLELFKD